MSPGQAAMFIRGDLNQPEACQHQAATVSVSKRLHFGLAVESGGWKRPTDANPTEAAAKKKIHAA